MNTNLKDEIAQRLQRARGELNSALASGDSSTIELRHAVAAAERDLQAINDEEASNQSASQADINAEILEHATREAETARDHLRAQLAELAQISLPDVGLLTGVAENVQRAGRELQLAREVEAAAQSEHRRLRQRLDELESERRAIVNRRQGGQGDDTADGPRLHLIAADTEGVEKLITNSTEALSRAVAASSSAQAAFDQAQQQFSTIHGAEFKRALDTLAIEVDRCLVRVVNAANANYNLGVDAATYLWRPSAELKSIFAHGR